MVPLATKGVAVSAEERAEWVRRFKQSGLSLRKFSAEHGLRCMTLCRWVNRQSTVVLGSGAAPAFIELKLPAPVPEGSVWSAELSFADGRILRLQAEVIPAVLEQLLRVC
jgi:transposase-like protein